MSFKELDKNQLKNLFYSLQLLETYISYKYNIEPT